MLSGMGNVLVALAGSAAIFLFWLFVFPGAIMIVTLYVCRLIPLTGRRSKPNARLHEPPTETKAPRPGDRPSRCSSG